MTHSTQRRFDPPDEPGSRAQRKPPPTGARSGRGNVIGIVGRAGRLTRAWGAALALAVAALTLAGCTANTSSHSTPITTRAAPDAMALNEIQATIDAINATARGPVGAQRAVLQSLAAPDQRADQRACPTATTTLAFDPAYRGLRQTGSGEYLLPVYITIYTGDRISGSDLATLHLRLMGGAARTSALCVS